MVTHTSVSARRVFVIGAACAAALMLGSSIHPAAAEESPPTEHAGPLESADPSEAAGSSEASAQPSDEAPTTGDPGIEGTESAAQADLDPDSPVEVVDAAPEPPVTPSIRVAGHIWRMKPGIVFLRTPIGLVTLSCKTCLRDLRGGPTVTLFIHGSHGAVYLTPRGANDPTRRYLWGPVSYATPEKKALRMWTPAGDQEIPTETIARKLASVPEGHTVTIEVTDAGKVLGVHDLHYDLQVSQLPSRSSQTEVIVTGSVSKIKNGYVHVKTDVGMLPITGKIGLCQKKNRCHAKVGQDLTLWIHDTSMAIDLHAPGSTGITTRLLSGNLEYDGPEKKALSIWTPDGAQSIPTDQVKASLSSMKEGTPIIVELDGDGTVHTIRKRG